MSTLDLSRPCPACADGEHGGCAEGLCGCIVFHENDSRVTRGFKRIKQQVHPERAGWTKGGFEAGAAALAVSLPAASPGGG